MPVRFRLLPPGNDAPWIKQPLPISGEVRLLGGYHDRLILAILFVSLDQTKIRLIEDRLPIGLREDSQTRKRFFSREPFKLCSAFVNGALCWIEVHSLSSFAQIPSLTQRVVGNPPSNSRSKAAEDSPPTAHRDNQLHTYGVMHKVYDNSVPLPMLPPSTLFINRLIRFARTFGEPSLQCSHGIRLIAAG